MSRTEASLGLYWGWGRGYNGWDEENDANLKKIGATAQILVTNMTQVSEPGTYTLGERFLLPESGCTGLFSGQEGKLAHAVNDDWEFYTVMNGWNIWDESTKRLYVKQTSGFYILGGGVTYDNPSSTRDAEIECGHLLCDSTLHNQAVNLPTDMKDGHEILIVKVDAGANTVTVNGNGKDINGGTSVVISTAYVGYRFRYYAMIDKWLTI